MDSPKHHDEFYDYVSGRQTKVTLAKCIVYDILYDLLNRRGLRQQFDEIDPDIQEEIVDTWIGKVDAHI